MWEIRKVWVVRVGMGIAYCGEDAKRAADVKSAGEGRWTEQAMVAVRFDEDGKAAEVQYLAKCVPPNYQNPLAGAEIGITRGA